MSECVVRMEMPKECPCELWHNCNPYTKYSMTIFDASMERFPRPKPLCKGCRIICQLPEGHGRLVDAELVKEILKPVDSISHHEPEWTWGELHEINCVAIDNAPTIVPAEAERSET